MSDILKKLQEGAADLVLQKEAKREAARLKRQREQNVKYIKAALATNLHRMNKYLLPSTQFELGDTVSWQVNGDMADFALLYKAPQGGLGSEAPRKSGMKIVIKGTVLDAPEISIIKYDGFGERQRIPAQGKCSGVEQLIAAFAHYMGSQGFLKEECEPKPEEARAYIAAREAAKLAAK